MKTIRQIIASITMVVLFVLSISRCFAAARPSISLTPTSTASSPEKIEIGVPKIFTLHVENDPSSAYNRYTVNSRLVATVSNKSGSVTNNDIHKFKIEMFLNNQWQTINFSCFADLTSYHVCYGDSLSYLFPAGDYQIRITPKEGKATTTSFLDLTYKLTFSSVDTTIASNKIYFKSVEQSEKTKCIKSNKVWENNSCRNKTEQELCDENEDSVWTGSECLDSLSLAKRNAALELQTTCAAYQEENYSETSWGVIASICNPTTGSGQQAINAATDTAGVDAALNEATTALAAVSTKAQELEAYKTEKKGELSIFCQGFSQEDYSSNNWLIIEGVCNSTTGSGYSNIDAAADIASVDTALQTAKDTVNGIKNLLQEAKESAVETLKNQCQTLNKTDYTTADWNTVVGVCGNWVEDGTGDGSGREGINSAASTDEVATKLQEAQDALNALITILNQAKQTAINAIKTTCEALSLEDYTTTDQNTIKGICGSFNGGSGDGSGVTNINEATTTEGVNTALQNATDALAGLVKALDQAKQTALNDLKTACEALNQADYTSDGWGTLQGVCGQNMDGSSGSGYESISGADNTNDVQTALDNAKTEISNVKNRNQLKTECENDANKVWEDGTDTCRSKTAQEICLSGGNQWFNSQCVSNETTCTTASGYWVSNQCKSESDAQTICESDNSKKWSNHECIAKTDEEICVQNNHQWYNNACVSSQTTCENADGIWENNTCRDKTEEEQCLSTAGNAWYNNQCVNNSTCSAAGGVWEESTCRNKTEQEICQENNDNLWINNQCVSTQAQCETLAHMKWVETTTPKCQTMTSQEQCEANSNQWFNDTCVSNETTCATAHGFWLENSCKSSAEAEQICLVDSTKKWTGSECVDKEAEEMCVSDGGQYLQGICVKTQTECEALVDHTWTDDQCRPLTDDEKKARCEQDASKQWVNGACKTKENKPTPAVANNTGSNNDDSGSSNSSAPNEAKPWVCTDKAPDFQPDLFQIDRKGDRATLYFVGNLDAKEYHVIFGHSEGDERYGGISLNASDEQLTGVLSIEVYNLELSQQYSFKVAPVNGCAVGSWSNWLTAKGVKAKGSSWVKSYRYN